MSVVRTENTELSDADFQYVIDFLFARAGLVIESDKRYLVDSRFALLLKKINSKEIATPQEIVKRIRANDTTLIQQVINVMTTNETSFFRDTHPFETLRTKIIPELFAARSRDEPFNIWCCSCSSGQEPYSIGMLLKEHFAGELLLRKVSIMATDLSTEILDRAKEGKYVQLEVNRGLPAPLLVKYFKKVGLEWQINEDIRKLMDFKILNLAEKFPPLPKIDIIFIRNVMIYFDLAMRQRILKGMHQCLRSDGYLFLGGAESILNLEVPFKAVSFDKTYCYTPEK